ncbi:hypothetical protein C8F01DRAFT_429223 [Mycena amicta]|nr:hypothetical protein C8F01DRAFT_429223 [Mycena amicta]
MMRPRSRDSTARCAKAKNTTHFWPSSTEPTTVRFASDSQVISSSLRFASGTDRSPFPYSSLTQRGNIWSRGLLSTDFEFHAPFFFFLFSSFHSIPKQPMSTSFPRLPPDLERTVFEVAIQDENDGARIITLQLILVARRCRLWLEPLLYRSLTLSQSSWSPSLPLLLRTLSTHPSAASQWIRRIQIDPYFTQNDGTVNEILCLATGVERLVDYSYGRTPVGVLCAMTSLERLCVTLDTIDGLYLRAGAGPGPVFSRLTHLHLLDPPQSWARIAALLTTNLPALKHLALRSYKPHINPIYVPALVRILNSRTLDLESLVVYVVSSPGKENSNLMGAAANLNLDVLSIQTLVEADARVRVVSQPLILDPRYDPWPTLGMHCQPEEPEWVGAKIKRTRRGLRKRTGSNNTL